MQHIDVTRAQVGDWLVLRFDNGNIVAGVLRGVDQSTLRLKVWVDAFANIQVGDAELGNTAQGVEADYLVDGSVQLYSSSELELAPLLSPVNDIADSTSYLDSLIVLGNAEG